MKLIFTCFAILFFYCHSFSQEIPKLKMDDVVKMIDTSTTPLVVNFWASWCKPCVTEIPLFEKYAAAHKTENLRLVLISVDFKDFYSSKLKDFIQARGYQSEIYWLDEPNPVSVFYKIDKSWWGRIPATIMVNNKKNYREFYNIGLAEYQIESYFKDIVGRSDSH